MIPYTYMPRLILILWSLLLIADYMYNTCTNDTFTLARICVSVVTTNMGIYHVEKRFAQNLSEDNQKYFDSGKILIVVFFSFMLYYIGSLFMNC
jgi:hypothetical protein